MLKTSQQRKKVVCYNFVHASVGKAVGTLGGALLLGFLGGKNAGDQTNPSSDLGLFNSDKRSPLPIKTIGVHLGLQLTQAVVVRGVKHVIRVIDHVHETVPMVNKTESVPVEKLSLPNPDLVLKGSDWVVDDSSLVPDLSFFKGDFPVGIVNSVITLMCFRLLNQIVLKPVICRFQPRKVVDLLPETKDDILDRFKNGELTEEETERVLNAVREGLKNTQKAEMILVNTTLVYALSAGFVVLIVGTFVYVIIKSMKRLIINEIKNSNKKKKGPHPHVGYYLE